MEFAFFMVLMLLPLVRSSPFSCQSVAWAPAANELLCRLPRVLYNALVVIAGSS